MYALSGRGAAVGVAALTTADNDFICVPNGRRWQVSEKKERNQDDGTNSQNSVLQINIAHIWRGWLGSVDGSMWNVLVEAFINVMCPLSGPQCAECVQLQIFWQKIAVQPTIHAMSMWLHLQRLRNLDGRSWGFVGGFLWVMIAHSSDNPEVQERFLTISY